MNRTDRGSAMVAVLLVMAVLTGLSTVILNVGISNLQNSAADRLAGGALGAAEAGVAQAISHMRTNGISQMTCDGPNPASAACGGPWGYNYPSTGAGGQAVTLGAGSQYRVWIQRIQPYSPPAGQNEALYRVHSTGTGGTAGGVRRVTVDAAVKPFSFPRGVFGRDYVRDAGNSTIRAQSLFSLGCIGKRDRLAFDTSANDLINPQLVPAAHSTKWISTALVNSLSDPDCAADGPKNIHRPGNPGICNPDFRFDQDLQGGSPLTSTACDPPANGGRGLESPPGSYFDEAALRSYGYLDPRGLPANQYAFLRAQAGQQGNFYDCTATPRSPGCNSGGDLTAMTPVSGAATPNAVVYAKLATGKKLTITPALVTGYEEAYCGARSLLLVVEGGDLMLNNNLDIVGAVFVPDGDLDVTGGARILGTVFARRLFLAGTNQIYLKSPCYFDNPPAGVLSATPGIFQEVDR